MVAATDDFSGFSPVVIVTSKAVKRPRVLLTRVADREADLGVDGIGGPRARQLAGDGDGVG